MTAVHWIPDSEWAGLPAVVIATGPSLTLAQVRTVALARLANQCRVIAVNDAALVCWAADIAFAADGKWWEARDGLPGFTGRKVQIDPFALPPRDDMLLLRRAAKSGYDPTPGVVCTHRNSGSMAVQLAAQLGAAPIVLLGFDMREVGGERHWFGDYEPRLKSSPDIAAWVDDFRAVAAALGDRLMNATPASALDFVKSVSLQEVLA